MMHLLVSDPGIISMIQTIIPDAEIHLSTQANMTDSMTARFWHQMGIKRIVLARELGFDEIRQLRENTPENLEYEAFVHGAMCISYSGRCLLSNFMIERDANQGMCAHPCRWKYALVEEQRPGLYYPIEEDERGTYILNSRDLCMNRTYTGAGTVRYMFVEDRRTNEKYLLCCDDYFDLSKSH